MQPARSVTNDDILSIAARHFSQKGLAGARVDELAALVGVNKATLYYRIGDKAALYQTILLKALENVLAKVMIQVGNQSSAEDKLKSYIDAIAETMEQHPHFAALFMREIASGSENMPEGAKQRLEAVRTILETIIKHGEREGSFRQSNPELIYMQTLGTLMFYFVNSPLAADDSSEERSLSELASDLYQSILLSLKQ